MMTQSGRTMLAGYSRHAVNLWRDLRLQECALAELTP